jgi:hypothetical protein
MSCLAGLLLEISIAAMLIGAPLGIATAAAAQAGGALAMEAGSGKVVTLDAAPTNVFVADPKVAEVRPASATTLFVFGVGPGHTTVAALDSAGHLIAQYEVTVSPSYFGANQAQATIARMIPGGRENDLVSVLVIQEVLDQRASILTCCLERRRGSATGPFHGEPARVTFNGAVERVRFYRATAHDGLREMAPPLDRPPPPRSRLDHLAGDERAVRSVFGAAARILDVRAPTVLEDMVGLTSIVHLRTPDGSEIGSGLGWHGTTAFVLRADFPRFGAPLDLTAAAAAAVAAVAAAAGLTTFETRGDANGPAVVARSRRDGSLHLIRPGADGARVEAYTPGVAAGLLNADQALWARYAQAHESLTLIDAYRDGRSDNVFVLAGTLDGQVTRHLIDADGTEVWRAAADDTAAAAWHRERVIGPAGD